MLDIIIHGCNGKMGLVLQNIIAQDDTVRLTAGIDKNIGDPVPFKLYMSPADCEHKADVVIDFSHYTATEEILDYCKRTKTPIVIATTGLQNHQLKLIKDASRVIPVLRSANMSLGVNALVRMLRAAMPILEDNYDIEIIEKHHRDKEDAPSGTSLLIADTINGSCKEKKEFLFGRTAGNGQMRKNGELVVHSVRGGTIPGSHTIIFAGPDETIELTHTALSNEIFASGALKAAKFLAGQEKGYYTMEDLA